MQNHASVPLGRPGVPRTCRHRPPSGSVGRGVDPSSELTHDPVLASRSTELRSVTERGQGKPQRAIRAVSGHCPLHVTAHLGTSRPPQAAPSLSLPAVRPPSPTEGLSEQSLYSNLHYMMWYHSTFLISLTHLPGRLPHRVPQQQTQHDNIKEQLTSVSWMNYNFPKGGDCVGFYLPELTYL